MSYYLSELTLWLTLQSLVVRFVTWRVKCLWEIFERLQLRNISKDKLGLEIVVFSFFSDFLLFFGHFLLFSRLKSLWGSLWGSIKIIKKCIFVIRKCGLESVIKKNIQFEEDKMCGPAGSW